jgi:hypothetical protein
MGASCTTIDDPATNMFDAIPHSVGTPLSADSLLKLWDHYGVLISLFRAQYCSYFCPVKADPVALSPDADANNTMDIKELKTMMLHMFKVAKQEVPAKVRSDLLSKGAAPPCSTS